MNNNCPQALNGFICHYNGKKLEIWAATAYAAQCEAARRLKVHDNKRYLISVLIAERADGSIVNHSTTSIF